MLYIYLFLEFFKVGMLSVGGGYATLPFLYHISAQYHWYSAKELVDMLAISSITPGPVGINVATFAGFKSGGLIGSLIATTALVLPSYLMVVAVSKLLNKFSENFYVQAVLYSIKPAGCALITAVAVSLFKTYIIRDIAHISQFNFAQITNYIDLKALVLLCGLIIYALKTKKDPLMFLGLGAMFGIILHLHF